MIENQDLETALRECTEKLDYCAALIRDHNIEPVKENIRIIGTAIADLSDILVLFESFQEQIKRPWKHKCSFCKKNEDKVKILIQGPGVFICNECVIICQEITNNNSDASFSK